MEIKRPMQFFDQDKECADITACAQKQYESALQSNPDLSAEEVFPDLIGTAKNWIKAESPLRFERGTSAYWGTQQNLIAICVNTVLIHAPHMAESLVRPAIMSEEIEGFKDAALTPSVVMPVPYNRAASYMDRTSKEVALIPATAKPSAYDIAQQIIVREAVKVVDEALFCFTDGYYCHISPDTLKRLILKNCRDLVREAGTPRLIDEVYRFLLCEPTIAQKESEYAKQYVSFANGVLDIERGCLLRHSPEYPIFYKVNAPYAMKGRHPVFDQFLETVTGGDDLLRERIWEMIGFCLVPDVDRKCFFLLQGYPDSGKSLLAKFIRGCINVESTVALDFSALTDHFAVGNLIGKQLCFSMDIPSTPISPKATGLFKTLTGGDPITADIKYRPHVTFVNHAKFIFGSNHPLLTQQDDPAFFRRAIAIPFQYTVPPEKQDMTLADKFVIERPAIVYDAIQAFFRLRGNQYRFSGKFPVNGLFTNCADLAEARSVEACVMDFLRLHYQPTEEGTVFVEDVFARFEEEYNGLSNVLSFGTKVLDACRSLGWYGVRRGGKRRKNTYTNPQAVLVGLCEKEETI